MAKTDRVTIELDRREHATVLAALRYWQHGVFVGPITPEIDVMLDDIASNGGEVYPLEEAEIDDLCERINR